MPPIRLAAACLLAIIATAAQAQTPTPDQKGDQPGGPPPQGAPHGQGTPNDGARGPGGPGRGMSGGLNIFFSPAGEPFRGPPEAAYPLKVWFDATDANHDGKIDRVEFLKDAERFFRIVDQDHNDIISSPENSRYEAALAPEITRFDPRLTGNANRPRPAAEPGEERPQTYVKITQGAGQYSLISEPQPIRACDSNLDYKVTLKEWGEANAQRFTLLDRNRDGVLELNELPITPAAAAIERMKTDAAKGNKNPKRKGLW